MLAARFDLDDARETGDPAAFDRLEQALAESSRLLRSTVAELHPAVLARAGLPAALRDLARRPRRAAASPSTVDAEGWPAGERTAADALLYRTAAELLSNVVKHAQAAHVDRRRWRSRDGTARLVVADDGVGHAATHATSRTALGGHIGLASHTLRVEAAGGALTLAPAPAAGTVATVELPVPTTPTARHPSRR